jgi:hypothetical protein
MLETWKRHLVFHEKLKTYHELRFKNQKKGKPGEPELTSDPGKEYKVEAVLARQERNAQWWYLVQQT